MDEPRHNHARWNPAITACGLVVACEALLALALPWGPHESQFAAAFAVGPLYYVALRRRLSPDAQPLTILGFLDEWVVFGTGALYGAALQTGVFRLLFDQAGAPAPLAWGLAVLVGAGATLTAARVFAFPPQSWDADERLRTQCLTLAAGIAALLVVFLPFVDLLYQEALHWCRAQHPAAAYVDHPGGVALLIRATTGLFGDAEWAVRLAAPVCAGVAALFLYRTTIEIGGSPAAGALAAGALSVGPFFTGTAFFIFPDGPQHACFCAAMFHACRAVRDGSIKHWLLLGFCVGLAMDSKYTAATLIGSTGLFLLFTQTGRRQLCTPAPWLGGLAIILAFSPVLLQEHLDGWPSIRFQSTRNAGDYRFRPHIYLLTLVGIAGPLPIVMLLIALGRTLRRLGEASAAQVWLALSSALPLTLFAVYSCLHLVRLTWPPPALLPLYPLAAVWIANNTALRGDGRWRLGVRLYVAGVVTAISTLLIFAAGGLAVDLTFEPVRPLGLVTWSRIREPVRTLAVKTARSNGRPVFLIGGNQYGMASILSYYVARERIDLVTAHNAFGLDGLTWNGWTDLEDFRGWTGIVVADNPTPLQDWWLLRNFRSLGPMGEIDVSTPRQRRTLYYRIGEGYIPPRDRPADAADADD